jgi:hypothetical protein
VWLYIQSAVTTISVLSAVLHHGGQTCGVSATQCDIITACFPTRRERQDLRCDGVCLVPRVTITTPQLEHDAQLKEGFQTRSCYQLVTLFTEAMDQTARWGKLGTVQQHLGYAKPCVISHLGDTF